MKRNEYIAPEAEVITFMSNEAMAAEEISVTDVTYATNGPSWD